MNARTLVAERLSRRAEQFPHVHPSPLDAEGLTPRDRALAGAIDHATARRWMTLVAVLEHCTDQPWARLEPRVQAALLTGAAQLLLLDRIPEHAAVNESVAWMRSVRPGAAGLVNAVLRRVATLRGEHVEHPDHDRRDLLLLADGRGLSLAESILAKDPLRRLSQQASLDETLARRWIERFGVKEATRIALHGIVEPPIIIAGLDGGAPDTTPHAVDGFHVYTGPRGVLGDLLASCPGGRVQDVSAATAVAATADLAPQHVLDLCAGRGTKTRQLATRHPGASVVATDRSEEKVSMLRRDLDGVGNIRVVPLEEAMAMTGRIDLLLLDVPCTNTGVLARRVEAKYRFDERSLASLCTLQQRIVARALPLLADDGVLVYTTCSLETDENEARVRTLSKGCGMNLVHETSTTPEGLPGEDPADYRDGGYAAILRR